MYVKNAYSNRQAPTCSHKLCGLLCTNIKVIYACKECTLKQTSANLQPRTGQTSKDVTLLLALSLKFVELISAAHHTEHTHEPTISAQQVKFV